MKKLSSLSILAWPAALAALVLGLYFLHPRFLPNIAPEADPEAIRRLAIIGSYFALAWLAGRIFALSLEWRSTRRQKPPRLLKELVALAFFVAALIASAATLFGGAAGGALAGSGLVIAILGFAIRNVLADILSGMALGLEAPFRIGDWVDIDGTVRGRVVEIGWRTTRLLTRDDTYMILPNSQISRQKLTNYSAPRKQYRAQLEVTLAHGFSVEATKRLLAEALAECGCIMPSPKPDVRATAQNVHGVKLAIRYWVPSFADDIDCRDAVLTVAERVLRAHGAAPASGLPLAAPCPQVAGSGAPGA